MGTNVKNATKSEQKPGLPEVVAVHTGDIIEAKTPDGLWWQAVITGCGRTSVKARLVFGPTDECGRRVLDAILPGVLYGKTWRLSALAVHRVPLTGQGVRNLNLAAPPALRNGRHFRKPRNWIAICPHPEEFRVGETIKEPVYWDWVKFDRFDNPVNEAGRVVEHYDAVKDYLYFRECGDCGAEVPA